MSRYPYISAWSKFPDGASWPGLIWPVYGPGWQHRSKPRGTLVKVSFCSESAQPTTGPLRVRVSAHQTPDATIARPDGPVGTNTTWPDGSGPHSQGER